MLTATIPEKKKHIGQGLGSLSPWTHIWSSGCPRCNLQLRYQFLVQSLWQWNTERKHYVGFNTSWGWWGFLSKDPHRSMETKYLFYIIPRDRRVLWGKIVTRSATMIQKRALRWVRRWWLTSPHLLTVRTFWRKTLQKKLRCHVSNLLYNIYDDQILEHNWEVSHFEGRLWVLS